MKTKYDRFLVDHIVELVIAVRDGVITVERFDVEVKRAANEWKSWRDGQINKEKRT